MTEKFTEEKYKEIITRWDSKISYFDALEEIENINLPFNTSFAEVLALANSASREWAHDNFVEKEEKYYWKLNGLYLVKASNDGSLFFGCFDASTLLSESELKTWGFNPDIFERLGAAAWD